ncbi:CBS domain-containing protein [Lyngbya aestuarii]|uniref:CBS domain-containing protein n=1 Tax=Lyngbya aestuarii TaxID=118322 RepID=UPI00403D6A14
MQTMGLPLQSLVLDLEAAIDPYHLSVSPDTPLVDVLALMSRFRSCRLPIDDLETQSNPVSVAREEIEWASSEAERIGGFTDVTAECVLVMEQSRLVGVFTERDIVRLTAEGIPLGKLKIGEIVRQPAITLKQSQAHDIFTALGLLRQHGIHYLPIVDEQEQPIGLVTHESIRRVLQPVNLLTLLRHVKDIMTTEVIHAPVTSSVLQLAELMTQHQVSCVVITEASTLEASKESNNRSTGNGFVEENSQNLPVVPVGIVTERDIVQFQAMELDLSRMLAKDVMSTPLFSLHPSDSLWHAHQEMQRYHVRRLIVIGSHGELIGIVSQTSLLQVLNPADMYGVIEILQQVVEKQTSRLKKTNERLRHEIAERQRAELALLKAHEQLKVRVEERTAQLTKANAQLKQDILKRKTVEAALRQSEVKLRRRATQLKLALKELRSYQAKLIQTEKMSSLGQLVAGIAHEINNPINFVYGNLTYASQYMQDIMELLHIYEENSSSHSQLEIQEKAKEIDLDFIKKDLAKLFSSMKLGTDRIRDLVVSLRNFSRLDEAEMKCVNLHEGLDNTLLILHNQLKATAGRSEIVVKKEYGNLPVVECYAGQLNQVFMNLLSNAIDALEESRRQSSSLSAENSQLPGEPPTIIISTGLKEIRRQGNTGTPLPLSSQAIIRITDNGTGITKAVLQRLFDPFFTTKPVGKGTGLGLSISYQIVVEKHGGNIHCLSTSGQGTEFVVEIPISQQNQSTGLATA